MIEFGLGFIAGILIMGFLFACKPRIERQMNQLQSRALQKGAIIEPEDTNLESWLNELKDEKS